MSVTISGAIKTQSHAFRGFFVLALSLLPLEQTVAQLNPSSEEPSEVRRWASGQTQFYLGSTGPSALVGGEVEELDQQLLINVAFAWNYAGANIQYGVEPDCVQGDLSPCPPLGDPIGNGQNEIHFNSRRLSGLENDLGTRLSRGQPYQSCIQLPSGICVEGWYQEADIFINRDLLFYTWLDGTCEPGASPPSSAEFVEQVLLHEMGHALGLFHPGDETGHIMSDGFGCEASPAPGRPLGLTEKDKKQLRALYGPFDDVAVGITSPPGSNTPIFPGNTLNLAANTSGRSSSEDQAPSSSYSLLWRSGDDQLGSGESISVPTDLIQPGTQEIVAEAVDAQGERLGSDSVMVEMVTEIASDEHDMFHPIPCVEHVGKSNGECVLIIREEWQAGRCGWSSNSSEATLSEVGSGQTFPVTKAGDFHSPWGQGCEDFQWFELFHYAWPSADSNPMQLHFQHTAYRYGNVTAQNNITGPVYKVTPTLNHLDFPLACHRTVGDASCELEISWEEHYFAPSSALFARNASQTQWTKSADMALASGALTLEMDGNQEYRDFRAFQYGSDVKIPDSSQGLPDFRTVISAPEGRMASDLRVRAVGPIDPTAAPASGSWHNPDRSGNVLFVSRNSSNQYLMVWLTYDESGSPVWYLSDPMAPSNGILESTLYKPVFDHGSSSISLEDIGTLRLSLAADSVGVLSWMIDGESAGQPSYGAERVEFLHGGAQETGYWASSHPGLSVGVSVSGQGGQATTVIYPLFYDSSGEPVWVQGISPGDPELENTTDLTLFDTEGLCPSCVGEPMELLSHGAGSIGLSLGSNARTWLDASLPSQAPVVIGSENVPVALTRITMLSQLLGK